MGIFWSGELTRTRRGLVLAVGFAHSLPADEKGRLINQIGAIPSQVLGDQESLVIFELADNFRRQIGSNIEPLA